MENKEININIDEDVLVQVLDELIAEWKEWSRKHPKPEKVYGGTKWAIRKK